MVVVFQQGVCCAEFYPGEQDEIVDCGREMGFKHFDALDRARAGLLSTLIMDFYIVVTCIFSFK